MWDHFRYKDKHIYHISHVLEQKSHRSDRFHVRQVKSLDSVLTMVLKVVVIPTVNGKHTIKPVVWFILLFEKHKRLKMLSTAYLKQGYPLPAIGKMTLINTQLRILKV